ncbi:Flavin oxidoreductase Frp family like protein, partial [Aduncisulcus paluster]
VEMEDGFIELMLIASLDAALVAQNVVIAAESLGLGGVYVGGIRNDPEKMSQLLNLPDRVYPVFGLCLGWPDQNPDQKPRLPQSLVFFEDTYKEPDMETLSDYDKTVKDYYIERTKGRLDHSWTEQMSQKLGNETRPHMMQYLNGKKFADR